MYGQPTYYPSPATQMAQQRLQNMEGQYTQYGNPQMMGYPSMGYGQQSIQPQMPSIIKGRPVANSEEANAAMIDFDGSMFVFPDKTNGKIYTKQLGMDGNIIFNTYSIDQGNRPVPATHNDTSAPSPDTDMSAYVKRDELDNILSGAMQAISSVEQKLNSLGASPGNGGNRGGNK